MPGTDEQLKSALQEIARHLATLLEGQQKANTLPL
jgi:hypothetical protein